MDKERTGGMTAIAVLNFTFSGMSIFSFIIVLLTASFYLTHPLMTLMSMGKGHDPWMILLATALLSLPAAAAAIVSGIGILKLAPWGRTWTFVYAILGILGAVLGLWLNSRLVTEMKQVSLALSFIISCIYPAILLYLISTARWKQAFISRP